MKSIFALTAAMCLFLGACGVDTTGISEESSRPPKGNATSTVVVMEFADLQCPACKAAHEQLSSALLQQFGSRIRFEFKHFPLRSLHRFALDAALASECAADQGKFWEFLDLNYAKQSELSAEALATVWPAQLKLDMDLYTRCYESKIKRDVVMADYADGQKLGVEGTPTFFVNGVKVASSMQELSGAILKLTGALDQPL